MLRFILNLFIIFYMLFFGAAYLLKYLKENNIEKVGWKGVLMLLGFSLLSLIITPLVMARNVVDKIDSEGPLKIDGNGK